jgi:histone acetyltransferase 1
MLRRDIMLTRLSQFVILPPYQQQGHGCECGALQLASMISRLSVDVAALLYSTLFAHVIGRPEVAELTVEDPAEAFEDLRDRNDLRYLVAQGVPEDPSFLDGVGAGTRGPRAKWEAAVRRKHKIAGVSGQRGPGTSATGLIRSQRQFDRLLEMLLLRQLDRKDPEKVKNYRLQVKARLYRFNYVSGPRSRDASGVADTHQEMLSQMTLEERKEALAKTYDSVVEDYDRILKVTFH